MEGAWPGIQESCSIPATPRGLWGHHSTARASVSPGEGGEGVVAGGSGCSLRPFPAPETMGQGRAVPPLSPAPEAQPRARQ